MRHVVDDTDREPILRRGLAQFVEHRLGHRRIEILRRQAVAPADHRRHGRPLPRGNGAGEAGHDVEVERFPGRAGLLGAVQHGDRLHRLRQRRQKRVRGPRAIQHYLQHAHLLAVAYEMVRGFVEDLAAGSDCDDDPLCLRMSGVAKQPVLAPGQAGEAVHRPLHDARERVVERVGGFPCLEEGIGIVRGAAHHRVLRRQRPRAERTHEVVVDHRADLSVGDDRDLVFLVRRPEAVEEIEDRHARLERRCLRDQREIVRLLHRCRGQHREARHPRAHHVGMVAKDRQRLRRQRTRRDVEDARREFAGDLVHVGQHQQQALRRRERGR